MRRSILRPVAYLQIVLALMTGCAPTQPFFIPKDNHLATYLDQALSIDYADVKVASLPEAAQAHRPLGPANAEVEYVDLSLEDCVSMALQNSKILRVASGVNPQSGSVSALILSAQPGQLPSVYDAALVSSLASTQPLQIDNNGNRVPFRGAVRSNQVGGVEDALSEFDTQFSSVFGYNTTDRPRNVGPGNPFNPQLFQAIDSNFQSALSKRLATGGVATLRTTTVYSQNNVLSPGVGRAVPSDYTQTLEMQLSHPLLRGRGTMINRLPVVLARINEDIALHDFEANVRNLVKATEDAYWDLYLGYRAVETAQTSLDVAADLWRAMSTRLGTAAPPEAEAQARGLYQQFSNALLAAKHGSTVPGSDPRGLYGREQTLREKIGWSPNDSRLIRPSDVPTTARIDFDWESIKAEALMRNTELRRHKWFIKGIEMELISAKNQLLPQLDLTGIYRWVGVGDELINRERSGAQFPSQGTSAWEGLTSGDFQEVGARIELTPAPIGARRALANIQNRKLGLAKAHVELQEKEVALVDQITTAWRLLDSNYEQIRGFLDQWQAIEDEIAVYRAKVEVVELAPLLDMLLRAEERRARAQFSYYAAVCEYNKQLVNIHYFKGSLLDLNNIALEEGPWTGKAYWDANELARQRAAGHYFDYGYTRPAVVSQGQVPQGMATEGQLPSPSATVRGADGSPTPAAPPVQPESSVPRPEFPDLDQLNLETRRPATGGIRNSHTQTNRGASRRGDESFEWGDLGLGSSSTPTTRAASSAAVQPASVSSAGQRSSPAASVQTGARSISSNGAFATPAASQQDSPQWRPAASSR
jgi:hypothetical protein